jgi:acyl-CoA thioester hydrolase
MTDYLEIHRGAVAQWECDHMGHWNVQFYIVRLSEGLAHLRHHFAMTPERGQSEGRVWDILDILVRYQRELHAGSIYIIEAGVMAVGESTLELDVNVINLATGQVAANMEMALGNRDLASGEILPWPEDIAEALAGAVVARRNEPRPSSTLVPPQDFAGAFVEPFISCRSSVNSWECDEFGQMAPYVYYDRATHSVGQVRNRLGFFGGSVDGIRLGSAALEYRMAILRPSRAGDVFTIRSGIFEVSGRTFRFGHIMRDDATGEICATYDVLGVFFDLDARKAVAPPPTIQENFAANMIEWVPARHPLVVHS